MKCLAILVVLAIIGALPAFGSQERDYHDYRVAFVCKTEDRAASDKAAKAFRGLRIFSVDVHGWRSFDVPKNDLATARFRLNKAGLHSPKGHLGMLGKVTIIRGHKPVGYR